jgi:hypothetical protein
MKVASLLIRAIRLIIVTFFALFAGVPAFGAAPNPDPAPVAPGLETVEVFRTNWIPRFITNVVEVRMPTNYFAIEYRTNRFAELRTNVIDVYQTNRVTRTRTNTIAVEQTQTNLVTTYQTNLNTITLTNWAAALVFKTNLVTVPLTNSIVVEQTQTNFVTRYQTNVNTLTLTNWETALVIKTNWVTQSVTNLVEVKIQAAPVEAVKPADSSEPKASTAIASPASGTKTGWTVEAARTEKPPASNQVEVQLKLKSAGDAASALPLQEWRVERADGSVLLFGQGEEFKRELPLGTYKVLVTARSADDSPPVRVRANLEVTRNGVASNTVP